MHRFSPNHRSHPATSALARAAAVCACVWAIGFVPSDTASALEPTGSTASPSGAELAALTSGDLGWQPLVAVAEGFRALLPRDETWEESGLRETIAGTVSEKKYFARSEGRTFSVGLHMLPRVGRFFAPSSLILSHAKKNVLITDSGRELSYERMRIGDYPGALLTFRPDDSASSAEDYQVMEVHLVLVGQRLYVLKASHLEPGSDRSDADRFFDSFEVLE